MSGYVGAKHYDRYAKHNISNFRGYWRRLLTLETMVVGGDWGSRSVKSCWIASLARRQAAAWA